MQGEATSTLPDTVVSESSEESLSGCSLSSPPQPPEFSTCSSSSSTSSSVDRSSSSSDLLSLSDIFGPEISFAPTLQSWLTFKVVGDNIDKNIQPQDMRLDNQTKSLHYFHVYAVRDRIDLSDYDDTLPSPDISSICIDQLLPSDDDNTNLRANYSILIARVLKKYMPFLKVFRNGLERHIRHQYYEEMSSKSEVVSA